MTTSDYLYALFLLVISNILTAFLVSLLHKNKKFQGREVIWRNVFDGNKFTAGTNIDEVIPLALQAGYSFLAWNGEIHFLDSYRGYHETGIKTKDLG